MDTVQIPTNNGCGLLIQRGGSQTYMSLISEAIEDKLDVDRFLASSNSINIADLGCSLAFVAVKNIVESVKRKTPDDKREDIQFQVFFNDHVFNRFDKLFQSLPSNRQYFAAGVPGSIHGRLFPKGALHFVNSSYALYWLSKIPDELVDKESPSFNKGKIFYTNSCSKVVEAYAAQFARDMEAFLNSRAEELVSGGLMALLLPCLEVKTYPLVEVVDLLGDCLTEMMNTGFVSEDKVDSFNFPRYNANTNEIKDIIDRNDRFRIEKIQRLEPPTSPNKAPSIHKFMLFLQTSWEGMITNHFGREIVDQVFRLLRKKIEASSVLNEANMNTVSECFILLQKKAT
ncbi:hypothetical protein L6452_44195 [Arctium lappa]|uniref:Uncharacterized protein n=1 Tax=Arctium lappa TaxID=4217 RepID=A0ACB8XFJ3_ARCLA|nr:hypothetical protein L6452_44195 [Arctium lappa]